MVSQAAKAARPRQQMLRLTGYQLRRHHLDLLGVGLLHFLEGVKMEVRFLDRQFLMRLHLILLDLLRQFQLFPLYHHLFLNMLIQ